MIIYQYTWEVPGAHRLLTRQSAEYASCVQTCLLPAVLASCTACFTLLLPEAFVAAAGPNLAEFGAMGANVNDVKGFTCSMPAQLVSVTRGKPMLNTSKNKVVLLLQTGNMKN